MFSQDRTSRAKSSNYRVMIVTPHCTASSAVSSAQMFLMSSTHTHHTWNLQQWSTSYAIDWGIFLSSWLQRLTTIRVQVTRISFLIHSKSKAQHSTKFPHITTVSALLTIDSKKVNTRLQSKQPFTLEICCDSTLIMQNLIRKASCYSKPTTKRFMS